MWKTILDLFFPKYCLNCNQEDNFICFNCFKKLPLNTDPPRNNLLISSYYKDPLVKQLIHRFKYDFVKDLAQPLGILMVKKLENQNIKNPVLIPIPLHPRRLHWRGFNQAQELASIISQELNIPVINNLLIRTKNTLPQMQIQNAQQRKENINQAFELSVRHRVSNINKTLILIDDISTTGATLDQAAKVLKPLKPKKILKLVIARG